MTTPIISILTTAFNREKYIAAAVESIINSTYQNWELIIVDDVSSDNTIEIAKEFEKKDPRIKVFVNEKNLGDYHNRNKAAEYATGKYIKYVDADDMIYPYCLEQMVYYMEKFPEAGYGLCTMKQDKFRPYPYVLNPKEAYQKHYFDLPIFARAPLSAIIKKEVFEAVGGFSGKQHVGDFELWHTISLKYPVVLMPHSHGMVWWREHTEQQMSDNRADPFVPFKYLLLSNDFLNNTNCPLDKNQKTIALKNNYKAIARNIIKATINHSLKKGLQMKKAANLGYFDIFKNIF